MTTWNYSASSAALPILGADPPGLAYGAGKFIAVNGTGAVSSSDGGATWTNVAGFPAGYRYITFGNGLFVAGLTITSFTTVNYATSPDGVTWTAHSFDAQTALGQTINTLHDVLHFKFVNGKFYVFLFTDIAGASFEILESSDGLTWSDALAGNHITSYGANVADMDFGAGVYAVNVAGSIWVGASLAALTEHVVFPDNFTNRAAICFGNAKFLAMCDDNDLLFTSSDGTTWTSGPVPPDVSGTPQTQPQAISFNAGRFYCSVADINGNFHFFSSSDASTWTEETAPQPPDAFYTVIDVTENASPDTTSGGEGCGYFDGGTTNNTYGGGAIFGPNTYNGQQISVICLNAGPFFSGVFGGPLSNTYCVVLYGTLPQNFFTSINFPTTQFGVHTFNTASADYFAHFTVGANNFTVWEWLTTDDNTNYFAGPGTRPNVFISPGSKFYLPFDYADGGGSLVSIGTFDFFGTTSSVIYAGVGPPPVLVPDVRGDTLPTAVSTLTGDGFAIGTVTIQDSDTVAVDIVFGQSPVGVIEPAGTAINLTVSTGPARSISKLTQKLLLYLHRVFDKDPHPVLAFRVRYNGTGLTWSIANGVLTLTATGGTGTSYTFNIANFAIGQLAQFIAALPGYSVPYQDTSAYALLSALALLDSSGDENVSNGDHIYGYTTLLWSWMDANSSELGTAKGEIDNALLQMSTTTAQDEWLDEHGGYYNVPREQGELDPNYGPRIIASVLQPRGNNVAIASAIQAIAVGAQTVRVIDAINDTGFAITYNGLIHYDGSEFYDAGLGVNGAYGFFDVDFSFDFSGPVTQSTYFSQILTTVEAFRDAGTQLRAVIFRNNGSTTTVVSDSFVNGIRVIVYDDFTGANFRLLENGLVRFTETGDARILES